MGNPKKNIKSFLYQMNADLTVLFAAIESPEFFINWKSTALATVKKCYLLNQYWMIKKDGGDTTDIENHMKEFDDE